MTKNSKIGVNWEDLPIEILANVLGRVGIESLVVDVPFVCKSWYKATLDPLCWKQLHFPRMSNQIRPRDPFVGRLKDRFGLGDDANVCELKFIMGIIDRSAGLATTVDLRFCRFDKKEIINYVVDKCPALKNLVVLGNDNFFMEALQLNIGKLKSLESLELACEFPLKDIITEIGLHCENFASLKLVGVEQQIPYIDEDYGIGQYVTHQDGEDLTGLTAIVTALPKLKFLALKNLLIDREIVTKIIKGCVNLVYLEVRDCSGFDEHDEELSKLASHIPTFLCTVSYTVTSSDSEDSDTSSDSGDSDSGSDSGGSD